VTQHLPTSLPPIFGGTTPATLPELRSQIEQAKIAWLAKTESTKTRTAYKNDLEQFLNFLNYDIQEIEQMTQIVPEQVASWRDHLLAFGGSPDELGNPTPAPNATVARKITSLRSFFSFLQNYGYRGANPAHSDFVKTPKVSSRGLTPAIEPFLVGKLLDAPNIDDPVGFRDRAILAMLAYMALRVDELHQINVGDNMKDREHSIICITGKGNEVRRGILPPTAANAVYQWIASVGIGDQRRGPLFRPTNSSGGKGHDGFKQSRLSIRAIQRLVKRYAKQVGIDPNVSVHSLRVTAATEANQMKNPLIQIQAWLGHADPNTTLRYIRTAENLDQSPAYTIRY